MAEPSKPQPEGLDRAKMKQYLVPAGAVAAILVLAGLVVYVSGAAERKMSDGSNGGTDDPGLKEATAGVKYRDIKEGVGEPCPEGAKVTMHYTGWLENGDVFDSSKTRGVPFDAVLKPGTAKSVIEGWNKGVPGMKKGGIRKLVIAPEKAYGSKAREKIPGNSTLIFEVELVAFSLPKDVNAGPGKPMSDNSNGGTDDPGLKDIGDGLKIRDLKEGTGDPVKEGTTVTIHYTGWTPDGNVFDTSKKGGGAPATFDLNRLIAGWQKGIPGMKPGGIRKLVVPPELGYGSQDKGDIPPNSTLIFEVELIK